MKLIYTVCFVISILLLTMAGINAQPKDGLMAYYPFNGNANDESEYGAWSYIEIPLNQIKSYKIIEVIIWNQNGFT